MPKRILSLFRNLFRKRAVEQDLDEELRSSVELMTQEKMKQGLLQTAARREALVELGGIEQVKEQVREVRAGACLSSVGRDFRVGLRQFLRDPGFAATSILTLALGLAAVVTIFAVLDAVVLRPLDFPHSDRIVAISQHLAPFSNGPAPVTISEFQRWGKSGLFEHSAAIETAGHTLVGQGDTRRITGVNVTPDFFRVFEVKPLLGRGFVAGDATPGHDNVIVISYALWRNVFGGDPNIIGKAVQMSDRMMTVIGVMPPRFDFPSLADVRTLMSWAPARIDFWAPLTISEKAVEEGNFNYLMIGLLKDKVTAQRAAAEFKTSAVQLFREEVTKHPAYRGVFEEVLATFAVNVTPLRETMSEGVRGALWMLLGAVGLLLGLVLFNLGNLLLTRSAMRMREFVVREALGATRWQILRQCVVEQVLLIAGAALISIVLADWGITLIRTAAATRLPRLYDLGIDARVMGLLLILCLVVAITFGGLPLLVLRNSTPSAVLQSEGRTATSDRRSNRLKAGLMALEIAASMVLLVGAGLLIQSFVNIMQVNPGFDPHNLLSVEISLNPKTNENAKLRLAHTRQLLEAFRSIPGVESAAVVNHVPLTAYIDVHNVSAVGESTSATAKAKGAEYRVVNSDYFETMRIPLVRGRLFRRGEAGKLALINRTMAAYNWPGEDAVGQQFRDGDNPPLTVIGVVGDIHNGSLETEPRMQFYIPLAANPYAGDFMIRARVNPDAILPLVQREVRRVDPQAPVSHAQTMKRLLQSTTLDRRFETGLISGFAAAALFLSMLGLFSMTSLSVAARRREFGVRLALGARDSDLIRLELWRTLRVVGAGLACGIVLSLAFGRTLTAFLYGVTPWSTVTYGAAVVALVVPAFSAAWFPARRAARVNPAEALRYE